MLAGILVPGRGYTAQAPLPALASYALTDRRAHVETMVWTVPDGLDETKTEPFVRAHVGATLRRTPAARPVIIAKSLGTYSAAPPTNCGGPRVAAATGKPVLNVPDGDHSLRVPGRLANYTDVLGRVGTAIEEFLDALRGRPLRSARPRGAGPRPGVARSRRRPRPGRRSGCP